MTGRGLASASQQTRQRVAHEGGMARGEQRSQRMKDMGRGGMRMGMGSSSSASGKAKMAGKKDSQW